MQGRGEGGVKGCTNYKELYGQSLLINAEINKQFEPQEFFISLENCTA